MLRLRSETAVESNGELRHRDSKQPTEAPQPPPGGELVRPTDRWLVHKLLHWLGRPAIKVILWNGEEIATETHAGAVPAVRFRDRRTLWLLLAQPDIAFGDAYAAGQVEIEGELVDFMERIHHAEMANRSPSWMPRLWHWLHRSRPNSLDGARANIHQHYDVGNDFYQLWLDEHLVYTCAYFPAPALALEAAQTAKMDHVCRKLQLQPGQSVIEAGCGWGALAIHMARHYGVKVRAFNISHQQIDFARARASREGLAEQVEFIEDDYRNITGQCDAFVSVGMLEHVGRDHYASLGAIIRRSLRPEGLGLLHFIGRNHPQQMNAWLEKRIFPGAYIPSLSEMMRVLEPNGFSVLDVENLRLHYARTLACWLERFDRASASIERMYDRRFIRMWRLYLAGSEAGFTAGIFQLFQVVFAHAANNALPWSRAGVYATEWRRSAEGADNGQV